jgi:hypothetical protein
MPAPCILCYITWVQTLAETGGQADCEIQILCQALGEAVTAHVRQSTCT